VLLSPLRSDCITSFTSLTCASPLVSYALFCTAIIMRFSAIAVTVFALAAQVTAQGEFNCALQLDPCWEVKISPDDKCDNGFVTYCLQPKEIEGTPNDCKDTYSHANVYLGGTDVDLGDNDASDGTATCTPNDNGSVPTEEMCSEGSGNNGCGLITDTGTNVGIKCGATNNGLCITVPINSNGSHEEVIFAVKNGSDCLAGSDAGPWTCTRPDPDENNNCACSGTQTACILEPISSCTPEPPAGGGGNGDPHFKTWRGHHFDYHGECDLVLIHSSKFGSGLGLDVHIRTKMRRDMSYISAAVLRMGTDTLEVESQGVYYLNGVLNADLPDEFSGFAFSHTQPTEKQHVFEIYMGGRERLKLKTYKDFVSVLVEQAQGKHFGDSVGLMGDFGGGRMLARDGKTVLDDPNTFGQEWQVLDTEPTLFQTLRFPQHPMECTKPTPMQTSQLRRRLSESSPIAELAAEKACEHWGEGKDDCVFDVLTTGDLEMAVVGAY
jgi:hypothetical protein